MAERGTVCVTGVGGYVASWLVKFLLSKGYKVHGTAREPVHEKNAHLKKLEGAEERLHLFKANLLDYHSLSVAISGCHGVLHVACPVPPGSVLNPEVELLEPAVSGTLNVLKACSEADVKNVIYVSSCAAVMMNPNWPEGKTMDENCWSDEQYCRTTGNWYCLSKTAAEREAIQYGEKNNLDVITVCPSLVMGPLLQPTINSSMLVLKKLLTGQHKTVENRCRLIVDVRDVAEALILTYEKPEASGRYICAPHKIWTQDLVSKLKGMYPAYDYPESVTDRGIDLKTSSDRLKSLGWQCRPLEETLADSVECLRDAGFVSKD